jgi:hypothetical protein
MTAKIAPGTIVLNQDTDRPQAGVVIAPPEGETDHPISLWVHWADGQTALEAAADVTLTAHLILTAEG